MLPLWGPSWVKSGRALPNATGALPPLGRPAPLSKVIYKGTGQRGSQGVVGTEVICRERPMRRHVNGSTSGFHVYSQANFDPFNFISPRLFPWLVFVLNSLNASLPFRCYRLISLDSGPVLLGCSHASQLLLLETKGAHCPKELDRMANWYLFIP